MAALNINVLKRKLPWDEGEDEGPPKRFKRDAEGLICFGPLTLYDVVSVREIFDSIMQWIIGETPPDTRGLVKKCGYESCKRRCICGLVITVDILAATCKSFAEECYGYRIRNHLQGIKRQYFTWVEYAVTHGYTSLGTALRDKYIHRIEKLTDDWHVPTHVKNYSRMVHLQKLHDIGIRYKLPGCLDYYFATYVSNIALQRKNAMYMMPPMFLTYRPREEFDIYMDENLTKQYTKAVVRANMHAIYYRISSNIQPGLVWGKCMEVDAAAILDAAFKRNLVPPQVFNLTLVLESKQKVINIKGSLCIIAARWNAMGCIKVLFMHGYSFEYVCEVASYYNHVECLRFAFRSGASLGRSLDIAIERNSHDCVEYIKSIG